MISSSPLILAMALGICPPGPRDNCVVDGDTFWTAGEKIRIADIDAPEMSGQCASERALAVKARDRLAEQLGSRFEVERQGKDRFGRTLAIVTVRGRSVGEALIAEGLARRWSGRREAWC